MGFLDKLRAKKETARVSSKAKVGVDLGEDERFISENRQAIANARKGDDDDFIESRKEARKRRGDAVRSRTAGVRRGVKTAKREWNNFKNDPEVRDVRKSFRSAGRRAESGMGEGHFEGFDAGKMLGMSPTNRQARRTRFEPVYSQSGRRIGSRRVNYAPEERQERGQDVFEMFGMRNGGYGQVRRNQGQGYGQAPMRRQKDPFDFSDMIGGGW